SQSSSCGSVSVIARPSTATTKGGRSASLRSSESRLKVICGAVLSAMGGPFCRGDVLILQRGGVDLGVRGGLRRLGLGDGLGGGLRGGALCGGPLGGGRRGRRRLTLQHAGLLLALRAGLVGLLSQALAALLDPRDDVLLVVALEAEARHVEVVVRHPGVLTVGVVQGLGELAGHGGLLEEAGAAG